MTKFLLTTDLHYSDKPFTGNRFHALSRAKLAKNIQNYAGDCSFMVELGDTVDAKEGWKEPLELLKDIRTETDRAGIPCYFSFGNHDTASDKRAFAKILGMKDRYYTFEAGEYLGIMLDAAMNDPEDPYPREEMEWTHPYVDHEQLGWLEKILKESDRPVLIFCHFPLLVDDPGCDFDTPDCNHCIINREEVLSVLENSGKVKACFYGHLHTGSQVVRKGIPHIAFTAMCLEEDNSCGIVTVDEQLLTVEGKGRQANMVYKLNQF